jgi:hypothetical protein
MVALEASFCCQASPCLRGGRTTTSSITRRPGGPFVDLHAGLELACGKAEIEGVAWHALRHIFVSRLLERGADWRSDAFFSPPRHFRPNHRRPRGSHAIHQNPSRLNPRRFRHRPPHPNQRPRQRLGAPVLHSSLDAEFSAQTSVAVDLSDRLNEIAFGSSE